MLLPIGDRDPVDGVKKQKKEAVKKPQKNENDDEVEEDVNSDSESVEEEMEEMWSLNWQYNPLQADEDQMVNEIQDVSIQEHTEDDLIEDVNIVRGNEDENLIVHEDILLENEELVDQLENVESDVEEHQEDDEEEQIDYYEQPRRSGRERKQPDRLQISLRKMAAVKEFMRKYPKLKSLAEAMSNLCG